jgi:hypothetical protein
MSKINDVGRISAGEKVIGECVLALCKSSSIGQKGKPETPVHAE